jgi:uncharacterized hydrophobic protein (TIGR00271 family)
MTYYIYSQESKEFVDSLELDESIILCSILKLSELNLEEVSHLVVTSCVDDIKRVMSIAYRNNISLGIVPMPNQKELMRTFNLPSKANSALILALTPTSKKLDILLCDGSIVIQEIVIGDAPPLDSYDTLLKTKTLLNRVKVFWLTLLKVRKLKHNQIKLTDAKENQIDISAVGMVGIEYNNSTFASKLLASKLSANDGKIIMIILSPTSILQYMGYLFKSLVSFSTPKSIPNSMGYISSQRVKVETDSPLKVNIDSSTLSETPIDLSVKHEALALSVGDDFWSKQNSKTSTKDSIKIDHLPSDKESKEYLSKAIPLFTHASKEQYTQLFTNLRDDSKLNSVFIILLILSTMIATFGLFTNSSSVVIGAMLLAPLMQPIVSLSMGVLRQDIGLEKDGAKSIFFGVLTVLFTSAIIASLTPIERLSAEMAGRLSPTILDMFIAIVSGVAAAYVKSNEKILGSLAGVAIAVALVPPIAVAGIGLGWGEWHMFFMAFLLFTTNLVGIVFAASITFMMLGFSPLRVAKKGIFTWLVVALLVTIPLYSSFKQMQADIRVQKELNNLSFTLNEHNITLTQVKLIHKPKVDELRCEVIATGLLNRAEKTLLKEKIVKNLKKATQVVVTFKYKL